MTIAELCTHALLELNAIDVGETPSAAEAATVLNKLHRLLNNWNAERWAVYASRFDTFTLTPSLNPHTIGPTGATWTLTQRPIEIVHASLILSGSPAPHLDLGIHDAQWYSSVSVPDLTSPQPTDLYYQPDWPNGSIYFWPIGTTAYDVELETRVLLDDTAELTDTLTLPPGYEDAITLTLAEMCAIPFSKRVSPELGQSAREARARIFAVNDPSPVLVTADYGLRGSRSGRWFNYRTGQFF